MTELLGRREERYWPYWVVGKTQLGGGWKVRVKLTCLDSALRKEFAVWAERERELMRVAEKRGACLLS